TWKFRIGTLLILLVVGVSTRGLWTSYIGRSLVCKEDQSRSDVIIIENFDPHYLVFERAAALQRAGVASRALVHVQASSDPAVPNLVSKEFADVMARVARLDNWRMVPIQETEPISLNAAAQIRDHLTGDHVDSLTLVTTGFRSRRSSLVYRTVFG